MVTGEPACPAGEEAPRALARLQTGLLPWAVEA